MYNYIKQEMNLILELKLNLIWEEVKKLYGHEQEGSEVSKLKKASERDLLILYSSEDIEAVQSQYHCTYIAFPSSSKSKDS